MKFSVSVMAVVLAILSPNVWAAPCDTTTYYHPCFWVETICHPEGYCDGYWDCDEEAVLTDVIWTDYGDGSTIYRAIELNKYDQPINCRRWCVCPNPNNCLAKNAFNSGALACP